VEEGLVMTKRDRNQTNREGLETAGVQRFVGSNPTPRTPISSLFSVFLAKKRLDLGVCGEGENLNTSLPVKVLGVILSLLTFVDIL